MITCQLLVHCCPRLLWEPFFDCGQFGECSKYQNHDTEMPAVQIFHLVSFPWYSQFWSRGCGVQDFQKGISNFNSSDHRTAFHFLSVHSKCLGSRLGSRSHAVSCLHDGDLTCICGCHGELCLQTIMSGSDCAVISNLSVFNAVPSENLKITGIQNWFLVL